MATEVLEYLRPERGGRFLDGTVGGGGHAAQILSACPSARLVGIDQDPEAIAAGMEKELTTMLRLATDNLRRAE